LAQNEFKLGNLNAAEDAFQKAEELNPMDVDLYLSWSEMYMDRGEYEDAANLIQSGIEELPESSLLYYRIVICLLKAGNFQKAFQFLENALILDFDGHKELYEYFPDLEANKVLFNIINQFREGNK
jgi:tetratricopeptide (TPR) repeat protein